MDKRDWGPYRKKNYIPNCRGNSGKIRCFLPAEQISFWRDMLFPEELAGVNVEKLLELRIFSDEEEVYYSRSCIGEAFQWRFASEKGLPQKYYITQYQTIDINRDKVKQENDPADQYGNRIFYTTVGGEYVLPIDGEADSSEVVCYLAYDKNGMAKVADYRLRRFVQENCRGRK